MEKKLPVIIPDRLLISPGVWNENEYTAKEISDAFGRTQWSDKQKISLWLNHDDKNTAAFVGYVRNPRLASEGRVFGDLEIWDEKLATLLTEAMAKFGISAKIKGEEDPETGKMKNFSFENFSVVTVPACDEAYINLSKEEKSDKLVSKYLMSDKLNKELENTNISERGYGEMEEEELKRVTGMEEERKRRGMSPAEFYAAPRDPPSQSALPIFDKAHTQNAMARFNQTQFKSPAEKASAKRKIIAAANKFGIKVSDDFRSLEDRAERGSENMEEELQEAKNMTEDSSKELSAKINTLSERFDSFSERFDKLISLLSKFEEKSLEEEEKPKEDESTIDAEGDKLLPKEEDKNDQPAEEVVKETEDVASEDKELAKVKKELSDIKEKLDKPASKTVKNLSSNTIGNDVSFSTEGFAQFLSKVNKPVKII